MIDYISMSLKRPRELFNLYAQKSSKSPRKWAHLVWGCQCEETRPGLRENKDKIISFAELQPKVPPLTSAVAPTLPPTPCPLPLALCVHQSMLGLGEVHFSFTVFLSSPELLSLLESSESSVAVDFCFNFCSRLAGFLLLWG